MSSRTRKILKWAAIVIGAWIALTLIAGLIGSSSSSTSAGSSPTFTPVDTPGTTGPALQLGCTITYDTSGNPAVQATATNYNSTAVPLVGVKVAIFDKYGDELGGILVNMEVVSIASDVTLTGINYPALLQGVLTSDNRWVPGTNCQAVTYVSQW